MHVPSSGSEDRGGGDSIQFTNFGRVGDKNFKEWRQKLGARMALAKFSTLQAQAIAGFSSCGETACYPEILRISLQFCTRQHLYWANYEDTFLTKIMNCCTV